MSNAVRDGLVYLDTSVLLKLVAAEDESIQLGAAEGLTSTAAAVDDEVGSPRKSRPWVTGPVSVWRGDHRRLGLGRGVREWSNHGASSISSMRDSVAWSPWSAAVTARRAMRQTASASGCMAPGGAPSRVGHA